MHRVSSRGYSLSGGFDRSASGGSNWGWLSVKGGSGSVDRVKLALVLICTLLGLWVFYDICCHLHHSSFDRAVSQAEGRMRSSAMVGSDGLKDATNVLRAPGMPDGQLPEPSLFRFIDYRSTTFLSSTGLLSNPIHPTHLVAARYGGLHVATMNPGSTRGNHLHRKENEVLVLIQGKFMLRVAKIGNDGTWVREDVLFEIGTSASSGAFSSSDAVISSTPIGIEILRNTCHALRNMETDPMGVAVFVSYYDMPLDATKEEPERGICRNNPVAFLA